MGTAFFFTEEYQEYSYGRTHPLRIERLQVTYDLCRSLGLFDLSGSRVVKTEPAAEADILRFHTAAYVESLKKASTGRLHWRMRHGLGSGDNPVFPGLWQWCRLYAGASLQGARMLLQGDIEVGFNIAGGLHHAHSDRASGFCYVNDAVLAIQLFLERGWRVLYLDIDAHHGDGVQWAFYDDPRVLTVSFHQDGRTLFPGTGSAAEAGSKRAWGYAINVPMAPGTDDAVFWEAFSAVMPRAINQFKPDVIVTQLGADCMLHDRLALLELTTAAFVKVVDYLRNLGLPWLALGGGGYNIYNVARAWTLTWAGINRAEVPEELPPEARNILAPFSSSGDIRLLDQEHVSRVQEQCRAQVQEALRYLDREVFPALAA